MPIHPARLRAAALTGVLAFSLLAPALATAGPAAAPRVLAAPAGASCALWTPPAEPGGPQACAHPDQAPPGVDVSQVASTRDLLYRPGAAAAARRRRAGQRRPDPPRSTPPGAPSRATATGRTATAPRPCTS